MDIIAFCFFFFFYFYEWKTLLKPTSQKNKEQKRGCFTQIKLAKTSGQIGNAPNQRIQKQN